MSAKGRMIARYQDGELVQIGASIVGPCEVCGKRVSTCVRIATGAIPGGLAYRCLEHKEEIN